MRIIVPPEAKEMPMSKTLSCECGFSVRAHTDDELVEKVEEHMAEVHPDLVGHVSREEILDMAEEA
jgi:predicted small metal-binding protein